MNDGQQKRSAAATKRAQAYQIEAFAEDEKPTANVIRRTHREAYPWHWNRLVLNPTA
jgi:hypothetical protein